jgi:hypothetical protein
MAIARSKLLLRFWPAEGNSVVLINGSPLMAILGRDSIPKQTMRQLQTVKVLINALLGQVKCYFTSPVPITPVCVCDAKSQDCEILCKNSATDLMIIIFGANYCKQGR